MIHGSVVLSFFGVFQMIVDASLHYLLT